MVVYGGMVNDEWKWRVDEEKPSPLSIFVYSCGLWINLETQLDSLQASAMTINDFTSGPGSEGNQENLYLLGKPKRPLEQKNQAHLFFNFT